jgi:hypothetical protein
VNGTLDHGLYKKPLKMSVLSRKLFFFDRAIKIKRKLKRSKKIMFGSEEVHQEKPPAFREESKNPAGYSFFLL